MGVGRGGPCAVTHLSGYMCACVYADYFVSVSWWYIMRVCDLVWCVCDLTWCVCMHVLRM